MEFDDKKKKVNKLITNENTNKINGIEIISSNNSNKIDKKIQEEASKLTEEDLEDLPDLD